MGWSELINSELDGYKIIKEIARGGTSRVYLGVHLLTGQETAIKVMAVNGDSGEQNSFVRRFEQESQAVLMLNHPNIVQVYSVGKNDEFVYMIMQLVSGGTLRDKLGKPLPVPEAVSLISQMARALHHAHQRNIVHRDVKPANMLVDSQDTSHLLLADFGIAKIIGMQGITKTGTALGTPEYMAPEQAQGEVIDHRADIYGLGCVLYETLAGRPPFSGPTAFSTCYQHVHYRPPYIRGFNPDVSRKLALIIEKALAKNPADRFVSAEEFAEALYPFSEAQPDRHIPTASPIEGLNTDRDFSRPKLRLASNPEILEQQSSSVDEPISVEINPPVLDISMIRRATIPVPAAHTDDETTRQTTEVTPVATPMRPRHTRPLDKKSPVKSQPVIQQNIEAARNKHIESPSEKSERREPPLPRKPDNKLGKALIFLAAILALGSIALAVPHFLNKNQPVALATATAAPTATATLAPTATLGPTATTIPATATTAPLAGAIARASANSVIDLSCSATKSVFPAYSQVYINICVNSGYGPGSISAVYYRNGAFVIRSSYSGASAGGYYLSADASVMQPGSYTVNVQWNNQTEMTLTFTVS